MWDPNRLAYRALSHFALNFFLLIASDFLSSFSHRFLSAPRSPAPRALIALSTALRCPRLPRLSSCAPSATRRLRFGGRRFFSLGEALVSIFQLREHLHSEQRPEAVTVVDHPACLYPLTCSVPPGSVAAIE